MHAQRGFTIVEVGIALVVVALVTGVAIPVLDNVTRAELRTTASKTSGMVKATYDLAVLSGRPCRLVFDFKANTITAEMASGNITLRAADDKNRDKDEEDEDDDKEEAARRKEQQASNELAALALRATGAPSAPPARKAEFSRAPGTVPFELPSSVRIADVMAEHMREATTEGVAAVHFFPTGFVEHTVLHFRDGADNVYGVEIEPLTGRTNVANKRIEYKEAK